MARKGQPGGPRTAVRPPIVLLIVAAVVLLVSGAVLANGVLVATGLVVAGLTGLPGSRRSP